MHHGSRQRVVRWSSRLFGDEPGYAALVRSSRAAFEQRLNWETWGRSVNDLLKSLLEGKRNTNAAHNADRQAVAEKGAL